MIKNFYHSKNMEKDKDLIFFCDNKKDKTKEIDNGYTYIASVISFVPQHAGSKSSVQHSSPVLQV